MEKIIKEVQELLKTQETETQKKILLECASRVGTKEWQEAVKELIKRMDSLKQ